MDKRRARFPRIVQFRRAIGVDRELRNYGVAPGRFLYLLYRESAATRVPWLFRPKVVDLLITNEAQGRHAKLTIRSGGVRGDPWIVAGILADDEYLHDSVLTAHTILDLGSHIGIAAVWMRLMNPGAEIACVEPDPRNHRLLDLNLAQNGIEARVLRVAIGADPGRAAFGIGDDPSSSTMRSTGYIDHGEEIVVDVRTFPQVLDELGWDHVDLLKMDIEGAEQAIIDSRHEWSGRIGTILMEAHDNIDLDAMSRAFDEVGFHLRQVGRGPQLTYAAERRT